MLAAMAMPVTVAVENILAAEDLKSERENLVGQMKLDHNVIGKHETITSVLDLVQRVAPTDSSVLIVGQSGTGKELIARAIHYNSSRSGKTFEAVNCAALAPTLLESELFGHVKGAFTGAIQDKPGRFELADAGTLFLDEIGEMPLDSQSKLLRVIEQGELRRVGDTRDRQVDVRIVAATNKPLDEMTADGKFREDLFYRLNIVRIDLPPLSSRGDDVDLLADHFIEFFCTKCGRKTLTLSVKARALLRKYTWPGNVRELKNVMERLAVVCRDDDVRPDDLPPEVRAGRARTGAAGDASASLADVEREHIIRVMAHTAGNKKEAAAILGIDRSTLYSKLKQYEIE
jgi:transcriptional regulator with PAS, ATPase and Fis domain